MKIYFVRHGHPDYKNNCLTELGHKQAAAAAERLKDSGIERVYSSSYGRAIQTAEYTADILGLQVILCDFMKEIAWGSVDDTPILEAGHPWRLSTVFASEGKSLTDFDWRQKEPFCKSKVVASSDVVIAGLDAWLEGLGYKREGDYYRVGENTPKVVAMFSHGGSSSVAFSHLFNIPFPQICGMFRIDFTGIAVVDLPDKPGELVYPILRSLDESHLVGIEAENL